MMNCQKMSRLMRNHRLATALGLAAIALETAKIAIKVNTAINFFMNSPFQNLRIIVCSVDFKLF